MVIEDVMSRLFRLGDQCSMTEIYTNFMSQIAKFDPINHYVFVFDKIEFKPRRPKHRPPSVAQPLPSDIELCAAGYFRPSQGQTAINAQPIPLMALLANRRLQAKLAAFLMEMAQADKHLADRHLYWDWSEQSYYLHQHQIQPMPGNRLGEADLAVIWWANQQCHQPVIISSVDSDVFLLAIYHAHRFHAGSYVHRAHQYWDLDHLRHQMKQTCYSPAALLTGFILSGTDFVHKGTLLNRVNDTLVARSTRQLMSPREGKLVMDSPDAWRALILGIRKQARQSNDFHNSLLGHPVQKPIRRCTKQSAVSWIGVEPVSWQYKYWTTLDGCWSTTYVDDQLLRPSLVTSGETKVNAI
jgi:hypothetical protein